MLAFKSYEEDSNGNTNPKFVQGEEMIGYFNFIGSDIKNVQKRISGNPEPTSHYSIAERQEWPIKQMINTYQQVLPTFPGTVHSAYRRLITTISTWPWHTGEPGETMKNANSCGQ